VRDEPVTQLLRQRVDLEELDFAVDHGHVAGVAQPQPKARVAARFLPVGLSVALATPYRWFRISPRRIQAWREVKEMPDRETR
jgi:hypothetical protein